MNLLIPDFETFIAMRYEALVRSAYVLVGHREEAEDIVQTALLRTYRVWQRKAPDNPEAYVRTVMIRLAARRGRRFWSRELPSLQVPETPTDDRPGDIDTSLAIQQALKRLPREQRLVIGLRYFMDMSEAQVADALDCPIGSVKSRSSRALASLRLALSNAITE